LGDVTCKIISEMTYNVSSGTLNPTILIYLSIISQYGFGEMLMTQKSVQANVNFGTKILSI